MLHICPCMKASNAYTHVFLIFIHLQNALCLFIYFWPYLRQPFNYWDFKWLTPCGKPSVFALITWPYYGWLEKCFQVYHTQCTLHLAQYCQGDFHHHRKDPAIIPPLLFPVQLKSFHAAEVSSAPPSCRIYQKVILTSHISAFFLVILFWILQPGDVNATFRINSRHLSG